MSDQPINPEPEAERAAADLAAVPDRLAEDPTGYGREDLAAVPQELSEGAGAAGSGDEDLIVDPAGEQILPEELDDGPESSTGGYR